jgi:hypothetical protein
MLFPEEENFTRSTYVDQFLKLLAVGQRAKWFLQYTYNLGFGQHGDFAVMERSNNLVS